MNTNAPKLDALLSELRALEGDRDMLFDLLIEFGERFVEVPSSVASRPFSEEHKAPACESDAYGWVTLDENKKPKLYFAVENPQGISAKALAVILDETLSGESLETIANIPEQLIYDIFGGTISMGKGQGLMGMVRVIKHFAGKI